MTITPFPGVTKHPADARNDWDAIYGNPYRILTDEELAEIMPRRMNTQTRRDYWIIIIASVALVFVAGWVVGILTVMFTL